MNGPKGTKGKNVGKTVQKQEQPSRGALHEILQSVSEAYILDGDLAVVYLEPLLHRT